MPQIFDGVDSIDKAMLTDDSTIDEVIDMINRREDALTERQI